MNNSIVVGEQIMDVNWNFDALGLYLELHNSSKEKLARSKQPFSWTENKPRLKRLDAELVE
jgi:hypothetical protein